MAKGTFSVVAIRPGRRDDYMAFWTRGKTVNDKGEVLSSDKLALTEIVKAKSKANAEELVRAMYPDHSIDTQATKSMG